MILSIETEKLLCISSPSFPKLVQRRKKLKQRFSLLLYCYYKPILIKSKEFNKLTFKTFDIIFILDFISKHSIKEI